MDSSDWFNETLAPSTVDDQSSIDVAISGWNSTMSALTTTIQSASTLRPLASELRLTRLIVQRFLTPAVVACGVAGNLINLAVLTRRWMKSSTNRYLTALAFCDVMYLILVVTISLPHYESLDVVSSAVYQRYQFIVGRPLTDTFSNAGVWLTLTFTVERYIGVCHPMRGKVWCTPRRAKYIVCVVCLAAAIVTFPEFFECTMVEGLDRATNQTRLKCHASWFGATHFYSIGYKYANQTLFTFLPLILLLVFNTMLVRQVMVAAAERRKMMGKPRKSDCSSAGGGLLGNSQQDRQSRDQQRITVMLISVVIVFLSCQLPQAIQHIYIVYYKIIGQTLTVYQMQILRITGNVFNLLVMVNCSANVILYSAFSTKFRNTFSRLFCRCLCCPAKSYRNETGRDVAAESSTVGRYSALSANELATVNGTSGVRPSRSDVRLQPLQQLDVGRRLTTTSTICDQTPTSYNGEPPSRSPSACRNDATGSGFSGGASGGNDIDWCTKLMSDDGSKVDRQNDTDRIVTHM